MKLNYYYFSIRKLLALFILSLLVACGGVDTDNSAQNSTTPNELSQALYSDDSEELAATDNEIIVDGQLTKTQLEAIPTEPVAISRNFKNLQSSDFSEPSLNATNASVKSQMKTVTESVDQIIIKYKDKPSTDTNISTDTETNNSTTTLSDAVLKITNKNRLNLKFEGELQNNAAVFTLDKKLKTSDFSKLVVQMKAADKNIEYVTEDTLLHLAVGTNHSINSNYPKKAIEASGINSLANQFKQLDSNPARLASNQQTIQALDSTTPNDPLFNQQWSLKDSEPFGLQLQTVWPKSTGSGVVVAVLDTGFRPHADLKGRILPGYDFISNAKMGNDGNGRDGNAIDPGDGYSNSFCGLNLAPQKNNSWQGTQVAGIIAANLNNGIGISGVAPDAKILPVRVIGRCGSNISDIADGIIWASGGKVKGVRVNKTPAKVINLPIIEGNNNLCHSLIQDAITKANANGAIVVADADGPFNSCKLVINAGSSYQNGTASLKIGSTTEAPFQNILTTQNSGLNKVGFDDWYVLNNKANVALVSGVTALMLSYRPRLTAYQVLNLLNKGKCSINQFECGVDEGRIISLKFLFESYTLNGSRFGASNDFIGHTSGSGSSGFLLRHKLANGEQFNTVGFIDKNRIKLPWVESQTFTNVAEWPGDFNGDGKADVLNVINGHIVGFSEVAKNGLITRSVALDVNDTNLKIVQIFDWNKDGKDDIIFLDANNQMIVGYIYFINQMFYHVINGVSNSIIASNFLDNVIIQKTSTPNKYSLYQAYFELKPNEKIIGSAKFLNTNDLQILVLNTKTQMLSVAIISELEVNGSGGELKHSVRYLPILKLGKSWSVEHIGDYNGNGQDDILIRDKLTTVLKRISFSGFAFTTTTIGKLSAAYSFEPTTQLVTKN